MGWSDEMADIAGAVADATAFGEAVTLADASTVYGVFDLGRERPESLFPDVGATLKLKNQDSPSLRLQDSDASGLAKGDRLTVRSVEYIIAEPPDADGYGMTLLELYAVTDADDDLMAEGNVWK